MVLGEVEKVGLLAKMGQLLAEAAQLVPAKYTRQENKCERLFLCFSVYIPFFLFFGLVSKTPCPAEKHLHKIPIGLLLANFTNPLGYTSKR